MTVGTNFCGSSTVQDRLDVESEISEARVTDAGFAFNTDAETRLGAAVTKSDQKHQDVIISCADARLLHRQRNRNNAIEMHKM